MPPGPLPKIETPRLKPINSTPLSAKLSQQISRRGFIGEFGKWTGLATATATGSVGVAKGLEAVMDKLAEKAAMPNYTPLTIPQAELKPADPYSGLSRKARAMLQLDRLNPEARKQIVAEVNKKINFYTGHDRDELDQGIKRILGMEHSIDSVADDLRAKGIKLSPEAQYHVLNIMLVESGGEEDKFNEQEKAIGLMQMRPAALLDVKQRLATIPQTDIAVVESLRTLLQDLPDNPAAISPQKVEQLRQAFRDRPQLNTTAGMLYLDDLLTQAKGDVATALTGYNFGMKGILDLIPPTGEPSSATIKNVPNAINYLGNVLAADSLMENRRRAAPPTGPNVQR